VAAHLRSDIVLLDEVLSVGDAAFQKKSIDKIEEIKKNGNTILLVSHNMNTISEICNKTLLLEHGKLLKFDNTIEVINQYTNIAIQFQSVDFYGYNTKLENILINGTPISQNDLIDPSQDTSIRLVFNSTFPEEVMVYLGFRREGKRVFTLCDQKYQSLSNDLNFIVPKSILRQGKYLLDICCVTRKGDAFFKDEVTNINIIENSSNMHLRQNFGLINLESK
jgi:lipopolysaccharide transport system ATP-binding protein